MEKNETVSVGTKRGRLQFGSDVFLDLAFPDLDRERKAWKEKRKVLQENGNGAISKRFPEHSEI